MIGISKYTCLRNHPPGFGKSELIDFLHEHLGRFRDTPSAIAKSIDYAYSDEPGKGGFVLLAFKDDTPVGAVVVNRTGMDEYIPAYILVYIAVDKSYRNLGIGSDLIKKVFELCDADVALHVEYDNPAKRLYERMGFKTKYAEMRWQKG